MQLEENEIMNIYLVNILVAVVAILFGYLMGGIPTGVIIGKVFFHKDPRDYFSHNSGGTNAGRVFGKKVGITVIILDMIKTAIPIYVAWALLTFIPQLNQCMTWENGYYAAPLYYWLVGLMAAIGHCWPIYIHFKGGKAVSCFMGANILIAWIEFVMAGFTYLAFLFKGKYVSLSSIFASIVGSLTAWVIFFIQLGTGNGCGFLMWNFGLCPWLQFGWEFAVMDTCIAVILIVRHRTNIQRLRAGTENKAFQKKVEN